MRILNTDTIIKVGIADDHVLFKMGIKLALSAFKNISIVLDASNGLDLLEQLKTVHPDVILLDARMPDMDGQTTLPELIKFYPGIKVIMLSMNDDKSIAARFLQMGASSYLSKTDDPGKMYYKITSCYQQ